MTGSECCPGSGAIAALHWWEPLFRNEKVTLKLDMYDFFYPDLQQLVAKKWYCSICSAIPQNKITAQDQVESMALAEGAAV